MSNGNIICLLAKNPVPGQVKSRLERVLGKKHAAFLARAFLMDVLSAALRVPDTKLYLAYSPSSSQRDFEEFLYLLRNEEKDPAILAKIGDIDLIPQAEGELGFRLEKATEFLFEEGAQRVVFIGSDTPLIQPLVLRASFELLREYQIVIGPTFDGGYYLIGTNAYYPEMFGEIKQGSPDIYRKTTSNLSKNGLRWQELELSYDIDGPEELEQLYFDIDNLRLTGENDIAYHTERCLQNLVK